MSTLKWDPEDQRQATMARKAFGIFHARDYRAYTPEGTLLESFEDAKGVAVFKKVTRRSIYEHLLEEDKHNEDGNDRDERNGRHQAPLERG
jgi:hypothetical protein